MDKIHRSTNNIFAFGSLLFALMIFARKITATDTITRSEGISVGKTLMSSDQQIELGFFSPGSSSKQYIGMWYKNTSEHKIFWVGNRVNPIAASDTASSLIIGSDGNLVLLDGKKRTVWSTNISSKSNNTIAVLHNGGNFIVRDNTTRITLWESFKYPVDTLIPGMTIGRNNKTGENFFLSSWLTKDDPSPGIFMGELTLERPPQFIIWKSINPYWKSGPWDGSKFIGAANTDAGYMNGVVVTQDIQQGTAYISYNSPSLSYVTIIYIEPDGNVRWSMWDFGIQQGAVTWNSIEVSCDVYGSCGPFGVCNRDKSACECLKGFVPKSTEQWEKGNWESGCVRRTQLRCDTNASTHDPNKAKNDGFLRLRLMKVPDHYLYIHNMDPSECRLRCSSNCSCIAHAYPAGIGCLNWDADLVDIQQFSSGGSDLFLRLAYSELDEKKVNKNLIIGLPTVCGVLFLAVFFFGAYRWKANQRGFPSDDAPLATPALNKRHDDGRPLALELHMTETETSDLPMFDFNILVVATDNFSGANKLGGGGFGPVYKGKLEDGKEIAVKRLSSHSGQGALEFKNEILLISKLQHRNLVRLLGYCIKGDDEKLLIYEYLKNKSLDVLLFDMNSRVQLDWDKRFKIIEGIARGLLYLHRDSHLRIIHRDLKASNILLDDNLNAKISDFGVARSFQITQELANTQRIVGTFGYISPEYAMGGLLSEKSDVYSFGVLLLEIISGMRNTSFYNDKEYNLIGFAWYLWKEGRGLELRDPTLRNSCPAEDFIQCLHIALLCIQDHTIDRPIMSTVVLMLTRETELPQPKQPIFFQGMISSDLNSQSNLNFYSE